jgi:hypothetical protein
LIELQNQMERQAAREWATLAPGEPSEIPLAPEVRKTLREPRLVMEVTQMERDLKRIRLELRWRGAGGMDEKPARLTTFVSPRARHWPGGRP